MRDLSSKYLFVFDPTITPLKNKFYTVTMYKVITEIFLKVTKIPTLQNKAVHIFQIYWNYHLLLFGHCQTTQGLDLLQGFVQ